MPKSPYCGTHPAGHTQPQTERQDGNKNRKPQKGEKDAGEEERAQSAGKMPSLSRSRLRRRKVQGLPERARGRGHLVWVPGSAALWAVRTTLASLKLVFVLCNVAGLD